MNLWTTLFFLFFVTSCSENQISGMVGSSNPKEQSDKKDDLKDQQSLKITTCDEAKSDYANKSSVFGKEVQEFRKENNPLQCSTDSDCVLKNKYSECGYIGNEVHSLAYDKLFADAFAEKQKVIKDSAANVTKLCEKDLSGVGVCGGHGFSEDTKLGCVNQICKIIQTEN